MSNKTLKCSYEEITVYIGAVTLKKIKNFESNISPKTRSEKKGVTGRMFHYFIQWHILANIILIAALTVRYFDHMSIS